jgi:hypothetical protein
MALRKKALGKELILPIVFADARDCSALIAWSVIRSIKVGAHGTQYTIGPLWSVPPSRPQDLQLLKSGDFMAEDYIRPYALCKTPAFLHRQAEKPRVWSQTAKMKEEAHEGARRLATHMRLERSQTLIAASKRAWTERHNGRLPCGVCDFDFLVSYGPVGAGFAEAHHKTSLANAPKEGRLTSLQDLVIVCANCHRMLHRGPEYPSLESLRNRVRHARRKAHALLRP